MVVYPCLAAIHLSLIFGFSNIYHSACVWPTALNLGCVTNLDTLFLVMGFISLVGEIWFMLISSHHICVRSMASFSIDFEQSLLFPPVIVPSAETERGSVGRVENGRVLSLEGKGGTARSLVTCKCIVSVTTDIFCSCLLLRCSSFSPTSNTIQSEWSGKCKQHINIIWSIYKEKCPKMCFNPDL